MTNKLNLGAENVIARIALAYSLAQDETLDLKDLKDSGGKEYSKNVLLGNYSSVYIGMVANKYKLHIEDLDLPRYLKAHLDRGLIELHETYSKNGDDSIQFIIRHITF